MHRRHRPKTWDDVIGNEAIVKVLRDDTSSSHVLLEGERGCGKTSMAHLLAKQFGASSYNTVVRNCRTESKIDQMRSLLLELRDTSLFGNKRVVILDEIQELSPEARAALLVPLDGEEGDCLPNNVKIIACTTNPGKIQEALYDRFKVYKVRSLNDSESSTLLKRVSTKENIVIPKWLYALIIEKAYGNPRRLLKNLDTVQNCTDKDEASQLLELSLLEEPVDILEVFKSVMSPQTNWDTVKSVLTKSLKLSSPESIRVGLMNIISARVMSSWFKDGTIEGNDLYNFYSKIRYANSFPEKAELVMAIYIIKKRMLHMANKGE